MKIIWFIILSSVAVFPVIHFSSDQLTIQLPNTIVGSGNTRFEYNDAIVDSDQFSYDLMEKIGVFRGGVRLDYVESTVYAQDVVLHVNEAIIQGYEHVRIQSPNLNARSNRFTVNDNEIVTLYDQVFVERNGGQIQSNELIYNLKEKAIQSNKRVKIKYMVDEKNGNF